MTRANPRHSFTACPADSAQLTDFGRMHEHCVHSARFELRLVTIFVLPLRPGVEKCVNSWGKCLEEEHINCKEKKKQPQDTSFASPKSTHD